MKLIALAIATVAITSCSAAVPNDRSSNFARVQDNADMIPASQEVELTRESLALEKVTSDQLAVVTVKSLDGQDINVFSTKVGNKLGVGQKGKNNGILIVVAANEKKVRLAVADGLGALLTDRKAAEIVAHMVPIFRSGDSGRAISVGVKEVDAVLRSDIRRPQYLKRAA